MQVQTFIYNTKLPNDKSKPWLKKINRKVKNINRKETEVSNLIQRIERKSGNGS